VHARSCQERCAQSVCTEFRFWENGLCTLYDDQSIVNFRERKNMVHRNPNRALMHSTVTRKEALSKDDFDRVPDKIKSNASFRMVEATFEIMLKMWNESHGNPIHRQDLITHGLDIAGRLQGRIIATLVFMVSLQLIHKFDHVIISCGF
jgi:hypothetical protein